MQADVMNINERKHKSASLAIVARPFCQFMNSPYHHRHTVYK